MIEHTLVLFIYSVIILALAIYIYVVNCRQAAHRKICAVTKGLQKPTS